MRCLRITTVGVLLCLPGCGPPRDGQFDSDGTVMGTMRNYEWSGLKSWKEIRAERAAQLEAHDDGKCRQLGFKPDRGASVQKSRQEIPASIATPRGQRATSSIPIGMLAFCQPAPATSLEPRKALAKSRTSP